MVWQTFYLGLFKRDFLRKFFIISVGPYTGETCGTYIDYCAVNRCENGGKCIPDAVNKNYTCR